jgi:hypothetical protein
MSRALAALLGIASVLPVAYLVYFVWDIATLRRGEGPETASLLSLQALTMALALVLIVMYLVMVYRSALVPDERRTFWAVVLLMGNVFALPVFWYFFFWRHVGDGGGYSER